jgi:hypothetical protein
LHQSRFHKPLALFDQSWPQILLLKRYFGFFPGSPI